MHWVRDRKKGRKTVQDIVHRMTGATADIIGLSDRGRIAEGLRADLNVIQLDALALGEPEVHYTLPSGGRRLIQRASGYTATILKGEIVSRRDEPTGKLPGRLVRI
jgi:N-acyl-D-aspartate/D-glutamate deacylase